VKLGAGECRRVFIIAGAKVALVRAHFFPG
jgi:hypothetical protein